MAENEINKDTVSEYWKGKHIPQQWYSTKDRLSLPWFNEITRKRYEVYYEYLMEDAEFEHHSGEKILEVGCGLGTDLAEFAKHGALANGVDLGQEQVDLTQLNFKLRNLPYESLQAADAENLPFEDNTFDLVYSFGVLHHTPNTEKAIAEVRRILKPDGQAIIMLYARGWKHYIKRCLIHGLLLGKFFKYGCNWQKVYNDVSEVHGSSPKTGVYTRGQVKKMFSDFSYANVYKRRLGEFIEYPPYQSFMWPGFVRKTLLFFGLQNLWGENWLIKAYKSPPLDKESVGRVIFKHY